MCERMDGDKELEIKAEKTRTIKSRGDRDR